MDRKDHEIDLRWGAGKVWSVAYEVFLKVAYGHDSAQSTFKDSE